MKQRTSLVILTIIILIGAIIRLYHLGTVPFRGDEAFNAQYWMGIPLGQSMRDIITIEPFPPLGYVMFRAWGLIIGIDSPESILRLFPAWVNLLGIPALYASGKLLANRKVGYLAALMFALHPFIIWHAQEFRIYAIWSALSAITLWLALRVIKSRKKADWLLYALFATITLQSFYFEVINIGVLSLFVLTTHFRDRQFTLRWLSLNTLILITAGISFYIFQWGLIQKGTYGGIGGGFTFPDDIIKLISSLLFGQTVDVTIAGALWGILTIGLVVYGIYLARKKPDTLWLLVLMIISPIILIALVARSLNTIDARYALLSVPAYLLLMSISAYGLWQERRKLLAVLPISLWAVASLYSLNNHFHNPAYIKAPPWDAVGEYLDENTQPDAIILQSTLDAAFGYYYRSEADDTSLPVNREQSADAIEEKLANYATIYSSIWQVAQPGSDWPNRQVANDWLSANMQQTRSTAIQQIPIRQFMPWVLSDDELEQMHTVATFDDVVRLANSTIFEPEPSAELTLWLYWYPLTVSEQPLTIFVHLIGDEINPQTQNHIWAQSDWAPQRGRLSTISWPLEAYFRDVFTLDLKGVPAGNYRILVGLYNSGTATRLRTQDGQDAVEVGQIKLK